MLCGYNIFILIPVPEKPETDMGDKLIVSRNKIIALSILFDSKWPGIKKRL